MLTKETFILGKPANLIFLSLNWTARVRKKMTCLSYVPLYYTPLLRQELTDILWPTHTYLKRLSWMFFRDEFCKASTHHEQKHQRELGYFSL